MFAAKKRKRLKKEWANLRFLRFFAAKGSLYSLRSRLEATTFGRVFVADLVPVIQD